MKILIVDDDYTGRLLLQKILCAYGECHMAVDGREAVDAYQLAINQGASYDLICLDMLLPILDGQQVLAAIRDIEKNQPRRAKVLVTSVLGDRVGNLQAFRSQYDGCLTKPIAKEMVIDFLYASGLLLRDSERSLQVGVAVEP